MNRIIYGVLEINNQEYPFFLDKQTVRIVDSSATYMSDFEKIDTLETVYGITSEGRSILFIDCRFNKDPFFGVVGNSFNIGSYMTSHGSHYSVDFMSTYRIRFYSDAINMFYSPLFARKYNKSEDDKLSIEERYRNITIQSPDETKKVFTLNGNRYTFGITGNINTKTGTKSIGELRTYFEIELDHPINYSEVIKYTRNVFDFFCFLNYSSNIKFDNIKLFSKSEDEKPYHYASYHIFQDTSEYENDSLNSIQINDFDFTKIGKLYGCIISLRDRDNRFHLYYPSNKLEKRYIEPITWLSKALVFEGLFAASYPNFKSKINSNFAAVKDEVMNKAREVQGENKKQRNYCKDIINYIQHYNGNLEEKFNYIFKKYYSILEPINVSNRTRYSIPEKYNYGKEYMSYRNSLAHGDVLPLGEEQIAVYRILVAMIYLLLIEDVSLCEKDLKKMVKLLFSH